MTSEEVEQTKVNNTVREPPSKFPSLPDEITENILARVSRWNYPSLSLVSNRFHSLLSSMARKYTNTGLLDEKIYVIGGCEIDKYYANWIEVFDIKTQSWSALPGPRADEDVLRYHLSEYYYYVVYVFQGKIYVETADSDYTYEPEKGTWKLVREKSSFIVGSINVLCEMGNVIYCCTGTGDLMWSSFDDIEGREWREIKGLEKLREHPTIGLKNGFHSDLVGCGGQLLVMWDPYSPSDLIWYAKISLESRCNGREVWGNVECVDVLTFPVESHEWFDCLAASV